MCHFPPISIMRKEIVVFGIVLLVIGLGASFYVEKHVIVPSYNFYGYQIPEVSYTKRPYQDLGVVLVIIGIALALIGFFISKERLE